ncbi:TIGR03620 family F420-dependent LLM class oxidoreductase [Actinokineospora globicatena]|uniref:TIGR03620 family F420-dependent LLM class oxidoreductase n=1 Tax=Actinokineospora globicatena TaxID=103729 RepID=UPI0020A5155F|nr:TIGR03620 family F420-dependent LLM class oxidoreductase [Actinokineospora globicatena]MCP2304117.1 putative F420-dependent oxidoreductase, MSMEG_4141 family [Actinokineospora globicatena]GLW78531.1 LLM class F420-dependent oxidoreductase [Actinokineospora globicatena]GLW84805.1 LLM class F420-dependent oxidoreductase [Actinokineospora globicatena]
MHIALPRIGLWVAGIDLLPTAETADLAAEAESLGYGALWLSEGLVRDPFMQAATLLNATKSLVLGTGIAVIWGRHPRNIRMQTRALLDAHPGRFVLGLGTSHARVVEDVLGLTYERPLATLRAHLDRLDEPDPILALANVTSDAPVAPRVLAALGPKALALARDRAAGAFTYLTTPEHTAQARAILGPDRALIVEQSVIAATLPDEAKTLARQHIASYLAAAPYRATWQRLGFTDHDLADGGSDRLVTTLVAIGEDEIARRVHAHLEAGADHVCLQALSPNLGTAPLNQWRALALRT